MILKVSIGVYQADEKIQPYQKWAQRSIAKIDTLIQ